MEQKKTVLVNKNEERHVHINSNLDISKLKKHYEPLEIQVTFNNNDDEDYPGCIDEKIVVDDGDKHKDSSLLTESKLSDINNNEDKVADEMAKLLAMIHIKDNHTIDLLRRHVVFLLSEITKRNTIIFSLLKHLDFAVNQDVESVKKNEQLNEYLNDRKDPVDVNDVISSSHWNPTNVKPNKEKIMDYDWQLDIFQYIKDNVDNIDTVLMPSDNIADVHSTNHLYNIKKQINIKENDEIENITKKDSSITEINDILSPLDLSVSDSVDSSSETSNDDSVWQANTIAVIGDNMLHGLDEKRLGGKNWNVKCRYFPEAQVNDFFHYIKPILKKKPSHLVCHVGTNDAPYFSSIDIYNSILSLKNYIEKELPSCKVIISRPIIRMDNCKANLAILKVNQHLDNLKIPTIDNGNFGLNHLHENGPNLNPKGTARLAMNIISHFRSLQNELLPNTTNTSEKVLNCSKLNPSAKSFSPSSSASDN